MRNPFLIDEPTTISFSGGRTSAYLLWRVLQANNGLPEEAIVCFANTGKEEEATLEFVRDCSVNWNVPIHWLEYRDNAQKFEEVTFETASRNGEPFEQIIHKRQILPNVRARFCTVELKIRTMARFTKNLGWGDYQNFIGIRADEPRRAAKMKPDNVREHVRMPLHEAGISKTNNCDLCFLKAVPKIITLVKQNPERAKWWAKMEEIGSTYTTGNGAVFSLNRPKYAEIHKYLDKQTELFSQESIDCFCGD